MVKVVQLKCLECGEWSNDADWIDTEIGCEDCGEHMALLKCPKCEEIIDKVYNDFEERIIDELT
jgi:hypothetical protein